MMKKWKKIALVVTIVIIDVLVYLALGIATMHYDDFFTPAMGEYGSWQSMDSLSRTIAVALVIWNVLNIAAVMYMLYWFISRKLESR